MIIALNQANQAGNYSVLRDLAGPDFRRLNSSARLAEIFGPLRKRNLDLSPVFFYDPKLIKPPAINSNGRLRLSGFFETRPEQVIFDLLFQQHANQWLLFGISLETRPAPNASADSGKAQTRSGKTKRKTKSLGKLNKQDVKAKE